MIDLEQSARIECIYVFLFSVTLSHATNNLKSSNHEIIHEKKLWTYKIPMRNHRKNIWPTKYPREKILDRWTTHEETMAQRHETHETYNSTRPMKLGTLWCENLLTNQMKTLWFCDSNISNSLTLML